MRLASFKHFYFTILANTLIILGIIFMSLSFGPILVDNIWFYFKEWKKQEYKITDKNNFTVESAFAQFLSTKPVEIVPVNKDFSLVIEKIGVNAPIVSNVSVGDKQSYMEALKNGVAHASTSELPSTTAGNTYLFAHTSLNFWQLGTYAKVFNLLNKLEVGDRVHVFYKGLDYTYAVINSEVLSGWDTYPITRPVIEPILTLQTCDPPGTTINRLVVTAKLIDVKE